MHGNNVDPDQLYYKRPFTNMTIKVTNKITPSLAEMSIYLMIDMFFTWIHMDSEWKLGSASEISFILLCSFTAHFLNNRYDEFVI